MSTTGARIRFESDLNQLQMEHVLQRDRDAWAVIPTWPFLAIDRRCVRSRARELKKFPVFSCGQLWQNLRAQDLGPRLMGRLFGGGTDAGLGINSKAFVVGKANAKANVLINWNPPLVVGTTPWCAIGTHLIYVEDGQLFQHKFGDLITVQTFSRPSSSSFDFTELADLRDRYNAEYLNGPRDGSENLKALSDLLDATFAQNALALEAADAYHSRESPGLDSVDYHPPVLTKYDRVTHDANGLPKIEVSFALLHYEKAIIEFNALKVSRSSGNLDEAFAHGVYCTVAAAACLEAIGNYLVFVQTQAHPPISDRRTPLRKINDSAAAIAARSGMSYEPLTAGEEGYEKLEVIRLLRNGFMHAKELENDIDPAVQTSVLLTQVGEAACRSYLAALKVSMDRVFVQLQAVLPPIVTRPNVTWMGDLEVP